MITDEEVMKLDNDINIIPFTSDTMGKNIFKKNIELTKVFLKDILDLEEDIKDIQFIDTELEVEKAKNYKFITDLGMLVNKNLIVNIELCRDYYSRHKERFLAYVCKLVTYDIKKGVDVEKEMKRVKQIIFACKERNEKNEAKRFKISEINTNEIMTDNLEVIVHYLETHKKKYYNKSEVNKEDLWFSLFVSNSLVEQNKILKELVSDDIRNNFIRSVINMSSDSKLIIDFNAESYNNHVHEEKLREAREDGLQEGIEKGKIEIALELIKMNMNAQDISKATGLSVEKIKEIEK